MKIALCFRFSQTFWLRFATSGAISAKDRKSQKDLKGIRFNKQAYLYIQNSTNFDIQDLLGISS